MTDLIRKSDAMAVVRKAVHHSLDGNTLFEDQNGPWLHDEDVWVALNALPTVTVGVKQLRDAFDAGSDNGWDQARADPIYGSQPMTNEEAFCAFLAALEPVAAPDPAAIREAALREAAALMTIAAENCRKQFTYPPKTKEQRDYQTGAIIHSNAAAAILALIPKKGAADDRA